MKAFATNVPRLAAAVLVMVAIGCGSGPKKNDDFFTSGSREADQRADQRMAKAQQLEGKANSGDTSSQTAKEKAAKTDKGENIAPAKRTLYERLGGEQAVTQIVDDWTKRALADPRVNWERKGVKQGGWSLHRNKSVEWDATPDAVKKMKLHLVQFLSLATGGPATYGGGEMKQVHAGMHIANPEFDAALGDLKATLDSMQVPNPEQKELLAIIESTRPQVVEER